MKKILWLFLSIILLSISSFAAPASTENWYFVSEGEGRRPRLPSLEESLGKGIGKDEKVVYLTFDAGYENGNVAKCVSALKEEGVKGTFFVLKHFIEENPALCKEITSQGSLICNHTASHPNITKISNEEILRELKELEEVYQNTTGQTLSPYFRPPEGAYSAESLKTVADAGYRTVFWSLAWADWDNNNQKSAEYAMGKLLPRVHNGAVILLHPTSKTNAEILPAFIRELKNQGYRFATVEELWDA